MTGATTASTTATRLAATIVRRCDELAAVSSMSGGIRRVYLSDEHRRVNAMTAAWMADAGLVVSQDAAGNVRGRTAPTGDPRPTLLIGSHLDTVVDAGRYDGIVGVLMGIAVVEVLRDQIDDLPVVIEVIAFSDEEGTRFGKALMGSSAVAGIWDPHWWEITDADGITVRRAFEDFGLDPARIGEASLTSTPLAGYLEAHIEQGPHLDRAGRPLGVVTSIASAQRMEITMSGEARHAGGTPYDMRHDALLGAAEAALAVEAICRSTEHIGTVGTMHIEPGAVNVIPGLARFSVDLRGEHDDGRETTWEHITETISAIATRRGLTVDITELHSAPAVFCAQNLMDAIRSGIVSTGDEEPLELYSPAGHDAMSLGRITAVGMLFLRNPDGISHHPDEFVSEADVAIGLDAFAATVLAVAAGAAH